MSREFRGASEVVCGVTDRSSAARLRVKDIQSNDKEKALFDTVRAFPVYKRLRSND